MRKTLMMLSAIALLAGCEKPILPEEEENVIVNNNNENANLKKFSFTLKGDFGTEWNETRGYLQADGRDLTDVWILDYDGNGNLLQQVHQADNTKEDFGRPVLNLAYGPHHVYFIASRGEGAYVATDTHTITFTKIRDTFYKDYAVDVVSTTNGNRAVTLDRIVTKLELGFTDAVAENAATFNIVPHTWYYGWNYVQAAPAFAKNDEPVVVNIPASEIGSTTTTVSVFGFSTTTEWVTDVMLNSKTSGGDIIGQAHISNVPFRSSRVTRYTGPLFGASGATSISLNTNWSDASVGTW